MARVRGVHLRKPPKGPGTYTSKEAALIANPTMLVADAAFPKNRMESVKNAAFRVNSGGRGEWSNDEFYGIWEYAKDIVLRVKPGEGEGSVEVIGFESEGTIIGEDGDPVGSLDSLLNQEGIELGGWVLLVGIHPAPEGWAETVNAPGSRKRKRRRTTEQPDD